MVPQKQMIKIALFLGLLLFIAQGCMGKKQTVKLMPPIKDPLSCKEILLMDAASVPYNDFILALDNSVSGSLIYECWKPLMKKALKDGRQIPVNHLAKAVHVFNRNDSKDEFSLAVYLYFKEIINGKESYRDKDKNLMKQYLSFTINNAQSKHDKNLEKAKLVCSRLDPELYGKFFR